MTEKQRTDLQAFRDRTEEQRITAKALANESYAAGDMETHWVASATLKELDRIDQKINAKAAALEASTR